MAELPVFDIEAVNWTNPIAVGFFDGNEYHEFIRESESDDVIWRFLSFLRDHFCGYKMFAHYAARYDNKFILASLCKHDQIVVPEAGMARLKWRDFNITFDDSYLLVPMKLSKVNQMFGIEEKGEWDHKKDLVPWKMEDKLPVFREYLKTDCLSLSHSMRGVCETLGAAFGVMPSISLSTTAAKVFDKCFYDIGEIKPNEEFEEYIRAAIYGGRNEVYRRYGENINLYDVRFMHVSCYSEPMPIGQLRFIRPNLDKGTLAEAVVKVPKDKYIGPLPYKYQGRLTFPVGEFKSWWDTHELRNAIDEGCDVDIRRQLCCEEEPILKEFGERVTELRKIEKQENFWKMFGLSLSGKFGQGRWRDRIQHISEVKDLKGYYPIDSDETYWSTKEYLGKGAPYIRPLIAMRVRSKARVRHYLVLKEAYSKGIIYYGDTDSVYTSAELRIGESTGQLQFLGKAERGYFIRQKLYGVVEKGRLKQRSAGFSDLKLSEEDFKTLLDRKDIDTIETKIGPARGILKDKEVELYERPRKIKGEVGDSRISEGLDTRPICLELRKG